MVILEDLILTTNIPLTISILSDAKKVNLMAYYPCSVSYFDLRSYCCSVPCVFLKFHKNISDLFLMFRYDDNLKVISREIRTETNNYDGKV